uniref:Uncharacterized protein n=1 Tax=Arundo donax TaxID=35708 RepID=A0A0A9D3K1_ARUDO
MTAPIASLNTKLRSNPLFITLDSVNLVLFHIET